MFKIIALLLLICSANADEQKYCGPISFGLFRVDRVVPISDLFKSLGNPLTMDKNYFCYESFDKRGFLRANRMAHEPKQVGDILVSSFPNCIGKPTQVTSEDLFSWKTDKGIGLGASEDDVRNAYGRPSRRDRVIGNDYRWVIDGKTSASAAALGDSVLVYTGAQNDLNIAEFGMQEGRVVWIFLSCNE